MIVNVTNTADISALESANAKLNKALGIARENIKLTEQQRNSQIVEASAYANVARTLANELGLTEVEFREMRLKVQKICEDDCSKRGIKKFAAEPPKFVLKNWK